MSDHWDTGVTATEFHDGVLMEPVGFESEVKDVTLPFIKRLPLSQDPEMKTVSSEGTKLDQGKARIDLIAPELLFALGEILAFGALKYGERNWEKGMAWGRPFAALMRHLWAWWGGKTPTTENYAFGELDMETGKSHLWHAACCLMMLVAFEARKHGKDDRAFS